MASNGKRILVLVLSTGVLGIIGIICLCLLAILALYLWITPIPLLDQSLSIEAVNGLFDNAGTYLVVEGDEEIVSVLCGIVEGPHCWYGEPNKAPNMPVELAAELIGGVGWKFIEGTHDNLVDIRCRRSIHERDEPQCEIDLSAGWKPIEVRRR